MKLSRVLVSLVLLSSMAHAQVGLDELRRKVKDEYTGDPSVVVKTESNIKEILKSWGLKKMIGYQMSEPEETRCSVEVIQAKHKSKIIITEFLSSKISTLPRQTSVEFKKSDRVLESLTSGLESVMAQYHVFYKERGGDRVLVTTEPLLSIGIGEGSLYVEIKDTDRTAVCVGDL